jgi:hypothetical protein
MSRSSLFCTLIDIKFKIKTRAVSGKETALAALISKCMKV